jgi:signal transduction histidine kinase
MENEVISLIPRQFSLDEWNIREYELAEKTEELESQKEELNAAIEELISKNEYLSKTLDELSQRKNELDQLIYRMSHDLRTPVTSILGVCHVMKLEGLPTPFYFHLDHIHKKGMEMDMILKSLSAFSLVAFEPIHTEEIWGRRLLVDVLDSLKVEKGFSDIHFSISCNGSDTFQSDKTKLFLLLRSIVKNALDFRFIDRPATVTLQFDVTPNQITFECVDNGIGIEPAIQPKIFNMFYRGSERSTGSGLGLYIVKQIVNRLKGSITVRSVAGDTSFKVVIPLVTVG